MEAAGQAVGQWKAVGHRAVAQRGPARVGALQRGGLAQQFVDCRPLARGLGVRRLLGGWRGAGGRGVVRPQLLGRPDDLEHVQHQVRRARRAQGPAALGRLGLGVQQRVRRRAVEQAQPGQVHGQAQAALVEVSRERDPQADARRIVENAGRAQDLIVSIPPGVQCWYRIRRHCLHGGDSP
ncbi:hypothetical protein GCM10018962_24200 [Dactylosporangium matsuzakiense]